MSDSKPAVKFDAHASSYRTVLSSCLEANGESAEYFAEYKLKCLLRLGAAANEPILDFGAGVGGLTELLVRDFRDVTAYEPSERSLAYAKERAPSARCVRSESELPDDHFATAVCAGVLHHIAPVDRHAVLSRLRAKLRPSGRLIVFEHNPLNPVTRRIVARCAFDDDAILLWPWQIRSLLRRAGFHVERLDYIVFFPHVLRSFRALEPALRHLPLGAQTLTVATRHPGP